MLLVSVSPFVPCGVWREVIEIKAFQQIEKMQAADVPRMFFRCKMEEECGSNNIMII